mmetsp:Transcript_3710/g.7090  ORF Transcript_3710/g.7090 Transcript_3710/m.7090 type:complete len:198 (-) Transcript_3710:228-821(-)
MVKTTSLLLLSIGACTTQAFAPSTVVPPTNTIQELSMNRNLNHHRASSLQMTKGFGPPKETPREKSSKQIKREEQSSKYDEISNSGGQQYNVFVRQFGSDDNSWFPCGSIAVPRGAQVSDAIFANEQGLKEAIVRMYPKLRGFEEEFEFGYNLKIYVDDPVEVATKRLAGAKTDGPSLGNWISNLLSPIDASQVGKN